MIFLGGVTPSAAQLKLLTPVEFENYEINLPQGFTGQAALYIHPHPATIPTRYYYPGPWLIFAFLQSLEHPDVLRFHICKYDEDYFAPPLTNDKELPLFDVFKESSGLCDLNQLQFEELIVLLKRYKEQLPLTLGRLGSTFRLIPEAEWSRWYFNNIQIPGYDEAMAYYQQIYAPVREDDILDPITIVHFSRNRRRNLKNYGLLAGLHHFSVNELYMRKSDPMHFSTGCINLDQQGLDDFVPPPRLQAS